MKLHIDQVPHRAVYTKKERGAKGSAAGKAKDGAATYLQQERLKDEVDKTKDSITALSCLYQLDDAGIVGKVQWTVTHPSDSEYASLAPEEHEKFSLEVRPPADAAFFKTFVLTRDRERGKTSKKLVQQHLASRALDTLLKKRRAKKWQELTFQEIKFILENE